LTESGLFLYIRDHSATSVPNVVMIRYLTLNQSQNRSVMKRLSVSVLLLGAIALANLQAQDGVDLFFMNQQFSTQSSFMTGFNANAGYFEGTPFFNSNWEKATIKTSAGNVMEHVDVKYESFSQLLMVRHKGDSTYIRPQIITEFSFNQDGKKVRFTNGHYDERLRIDRNKYLQVLNEGYWSLYKDVQKVYKEANYDPVFQTGNRYDRFEEQTRYLFVNPKGEWTALIPRRRFVERFFGDEARNVREFVRVENLDYGNDEDLVKIFEYVNKD